MKKVLSNKAGFTMVELLVGIFMFTVVSIAVTEIYFSFFNNYLTQKRREDMQYTSIEGMNYLEEQLRMGRRFRLNANNDDDEIIFNDQDGVVNRIFIENGQLVHYVGANRQRIIFTNEYFYDVIFRLDPPLINVEVFLRETIKGENFTHNIKTTVFQRMEDLEET